MLKSLITVTALCSFGSVSEAAEIRVTINGIESLAGTVRAALYDGPEGFPSNRQIVQGQTVTASVPSTVVQFNNVPPGNYAIAVYHDQNGDGSLSTNFVGMPKEPFGFSRNARRQLGAPTFSEAAFTVGSSDIQMSINLNN